MAYDRPTMRQIAQKVGVSQPLVSAVMNGNYKYIKVSARTREKVLRVVREVGYIPDGTARALSRKRTGHIGFMLSDVVAEGWANAYYAECLNGVEAVCRQRGYGLNISLYNLSNVDGFVFPEKVGQRSVDGLILTAYVEAGVVTRFREFGIPCVCIGDNVEVAELIPTISADVASGFFQAVEHAAGLGHRRILLYEAPTRRGREIKEKVLCLVGQTPSLSTCHLTFYTIPGCLGDYSAGKPLAEIWFSTPEAKRPTCIISSPQTTVALFGELKDRGVRCPRDISLISSGETSLCRYFSPRLTTFHFDHQEVSRFAVNMLLDHLEKGMPLTAEMSKNDFPCFLTVRESLRTGTDEVGGLE